LGIVVSCPLLWFRLPKTKIKDIQEKIDFVHGVHSRGCEEGSEHERENLPDPVLIF
jgi:hypothetical protein